jgi:lysylphosphatidylglycerol synthetase-like protein (DUF2156 family)
MSINEIAHEIAQKLWSWLIGLDVIWAVIILVSLAALAYLKKAHTFELTKKAWWWARIAAFGGILFVWLASGYVIKNGGAAWWIVGLMMLLAVCIIVLVKTRRFKLSQQPHADGDESREWTDADKEKFKRLMDAQRQGGH